MHSLTCVGLIGWLLTTGASAPPEYAAKEQVAKLLVEHLSRREFDAAVKQFDRAMANALPRPKLEATWAQMVASAGPFQRIQGVRAQPVGPYVAALVAIRFEHSVVTAKIVLDAENHVSGFWVFPGDLTGDWALPPYATAGHFTEQAVHVGPNKLPGHVTLPLGDGPFPGIVLVHGSGPNDEDETLGPNKVFKDLAYGLAMQGVATLRYEKRTHAGHPVETVKDEVLDDAAAAVEVLRHAAHVDSKRVFVLGHSLGAYLMPWFARDNPGVAGVLLMAAPARPMMDLVVEQMAYLASMDTTGAQAAALDEAKRLAARSEAKDLKPDEEVFHAKGKYWLALRGYQPVDVAAQLKLPMLMLQGERDYQVSAAKDFGAFQKALSGHKNVTLKSYPALDHLFIPGEGKSTPAEYDRPSHVDAAVVSDIAHWIAAQR